jgi:hypothetical protein
LLAFRFFVGLLFLLGCNTKNDKTLAIAQITDYQGVMEQEKDQLQADLAEKDKMYEQEKLVMSQLLAEAEANQEQQNSETLYVARSLFFFLFYSFAV